jgi:hypothetical protein
MYVTVSRGSSYTAEVRMLCTVHRDGRDIPVTIDVSYRNGDLLDGAVQFPLTPWRRTVPATGQKDELVGNPLRLRPAGGRLRVLFGGSDGFAIALPRKAGSAAPAAPKDFADFSPSSWGGKFDDAKLNADLLIREGLVDLERRADGVWTATVNMTFVVKTTDGDVLVKLTGTYPPGRIDGDALKFPATKLTRTIVSTGAQNEMDANPLEIRREPDGRAELKFVGEGGFTLTVVRR